MQTTETDTPPAQPESAPTPQQKGGAKAAAVFWARYPTPEARSQYMKERFAKVKAKRLKKTLPKYHAQPQKQKSRIEAEEEEAAHTIYDLRIFLGDVLDLLISCNANGHAGEARDIAGDNISRHVLLAAFSILERGLMRLRCDVNSWRVK